MVDVVARDPEKNRPMENQDEREQSQQGTRGPPTPGAPPFVEAIAEVIHEGGNLFPRGERATCARQVRPGSRPSAYSA